VLLLMKGLGRMMTIAAVADAVGMGRLLLLLLASLLLLPRLLWLLLLLCLLSRLLRLSVHDESRECCESPARCVRIDSCCCY
jgi:hypothetical protein